MTYRYLYYGLTVSSEIRLPELTKIDGATVEREPDIALTTGDVPETLPHAEIRMPTYEVCHQQFFLLRAPGIARYLVTWPGEVRIEAHIDENDARVRTFILGTVFSLILHQRGLMVMHASAARFGKHTLLFCGPSGAGKSTMAASLANMGGQIISDDISVIDTSKEDSPIILPSMSCVKLWPDVLDMFDMEPKDKELLSLNKYHVEFDICLSPAPVTHLFQLEKANPGQTNAVAFNQGQQALRVVSKNIYRPRIVAKMQLSSRKHADAATLAASICVGTIKRAKNLEAIHETADWLLRNLDAPR